MQSPGTRHVVPIIRIAPAAGYANFNAGADAREDTQATPYDTLG